MSVVPRVKKYRIVITVLLSVALLTLLMPNKGKFKYEYQRGRPWLYETLVAPVDFPILKSQQELRQEREHIASEMIPHYRLKPYNQVVDGVNQFFTGIVPDSIRFGLLGELTLLYNMGVLDEFPDSSYKGGVISLTGENSATYIQIKNLKSATEAYSHLASFLESSGYSANLLRGELFTTGTIPPNIIFDNPSTQNSLKSAIAEISPTKGIIYSGQLIISNGEIVTAYVEQILDSFRAEYELSMGFSGSIGLLKLGHFLISATILLLFILVLRFISPQIFYDAKSLNFIILLFFIVFLSSLLVMESGSRYLFIIPYSVIALYLYSFFPSMVVIPLYMIIMLPIVFIAPGGFELYYANIAAGATAFYTFRYWDRGWLQFINSLFIFAALSLSYISFRLVEDGSLILPDSMILIFFAWNSLLVIAAYPFLFLFEKFFGLVSNSRLRDLSDATTPLLTRLAEEAPGTFQHSLQVANLAESASKEIGANMLLSRVGSLYHDIGKLSNPLYFIENIPAGEVNPHKDLSPEKSASLIIDHIDEGVVLAKKMRLPSIVVDFIKTHHGRSQTQYFYNQYINSGGDEKDVDLFTYKGDLPTSKEHVVVMMADAVEASSRTLKDYSSDSISALVDKIIDERVKDNQLIDSQITLKEIDIIRSVFKTKLLQSYHGRVVYPERK